VNEHRRKYYGVWALRQWCQLCSNADTWYWNRFSCAGGTYTETRCGSNCAPPHPKASHCDQTQKVIAANTTRVAWSSILLIQTLFKANYWPMYEAPIQIKINTVFYTSGSLASANLRKKVWSKCHGLLQRLFSSGCWICCYQYQCTCGQITVPTYETFHVPVGWPDIRPSQQECLLSGRKCRPSRQGRLHHNISYLVLLDSFGDNVVLLCWHHL